MAETFDPNVRYFYSQQDDERVILVVRRHILELFPTFVIVGFIYLLVLLAIFVFPFVFTSLVTGFAYNFYVLIVSLIALLNTVALFSVWTLHYLHVSILTNEHFVEINQSGIFSRRISELSLDKIQDVTSSQHGVFNSVFNIGTLLIETAGEVENFELNYIPDPYQTSQKIMEIEEEFSKRHGIRGDGINSNANVVANHVVGAETSQAQQEPNIEFPGEDPTQEG